MTGTEPAYIRDKILNHIANLATYTPPTTVYAAACKTVADGGAAPTASSPGTEFTSDEDTGYTRVALTLANLFSLTTGVLTTIIDILWSQNTGSAAWKNCGWVEFYDSSTSGGSNNRCLPWLVVGSPVACPINEQLKIPAGSATETGS